MAQFLEKKTQYVRLTDVSGTSLTSTSNALNVNVINQASNAANVHVLSTPPVMCGSHGNAFLDSSVGSDVSSVGIDCSSCSNIAVFGKVGAVTGTAPGLLIYVSQNNGSYYNTGSVISLTSDSDFYGEASVPARYVKLQAKSNADGHTSALNVVATVAGKN